MNILLEICQAMKKVTNIWFCAQIETWGEYSYFFIFIYVYASLHIYLYVELFFSSNILKKTLTYSWISFVLSRAFGISALLRVYSMALDEGEKKARLYAGCFIF